MVDRLYNLYIRAYADAAQIFVRGLGPHEPQLEPRSATPSAVEAVVAEFALHDATNGTPLRSRAHFERAIRTGAEALSRLAACGAAQRGGRMPASAGEGAP